MNGCAYIYYSIHNTYHIYIHILYIIVIHIQFWCVRCIVRVPQWRTDGLSTLFRIAHGKHTVTFGYSWYR